MANASPARVSSRSLTLILAILLLACTLSYLAYNLYHIAVISNTQHLYDNTDRTITQPSHTKLPALSATAAPRIAILVVGDANAAIKYAQHWSSLRCYAHRWQYTVIVEANDRDKYPACRDMTNFYFRKHCAAAHTIAALQQQYDYWLIVDGDVFVVNANTSLSPWLPTDPRIHIVMYERFHDGEIMAGTYLVRSSPTAVAYLMQWSNMHFTLEIDGQTNNDNGALHLHVVNWLHGNQTTHWAECRKRASHIFSMGQYDAYVGCTKCVMGRRRIWPERALMIMRRGHFVSRDFFVSSPGDGVPVVDNIGMVGPGDVFFHGWKEAITGVWWEEDVNETTCVLEKDWTPRLRAKVKGSVSEVLGQIRLRDAYVIRDRGGAVPITDVSGCWPKCPPELTVEQEQQIRDRTCPDGLKEYYKTHSE